MKAIRYITLTDDPCCFGSEFDGDPAEINDALEAAAFECGIEVYRDTDSEQVRRKVDASDPDGLGSEIDWFSQWCKDPETDWLHWFAAH